MAELNIDLVVTGEDLGLIEAVMAFKNDAKEHKRGRMALSKANRDAYNNLQDWSHKVEGQSKEFLPKVSQTADQFAAFIKKGLVSFGDWFSVEVKEDCPISGESIRRLMMNFLDKIPDGNKTKPFATIISDAVKVALLESLMIFKVYGSKIPEKVFRINGEELKLTDRSPFRVRVDLISGDDYYPDPTGENLYEIHSVERDIHYIQDLSEGEDPVYDPKVVDLIKEDVKRKDEETRQDKDTRKRQKPSFRKRVVLDEFYGTLLKLDGSVGKRNVFCSIANEKYAIRKPVPNPFWDGESCFVAIPILRQPFTVWHKALYDQVTPLNLAINELFNLMLDGGISEVWGIKQLRMDMLEDPRQVSGGIPQGKTLVLKEGASQDADVLKQVSTGKVPQGALEMYRILDREYNAAAMTSDLKQGFLPPRQVKATEVNEASQSQAIVLDSVVVDIERGIGQILTKFWITLLQNADDLPVDELSNALTLKETLMLSRMSDLERFKLFKSCGFKVFGLSATLAKARDFQKILALLQVAQQNPLLAPVMIRKTSPERLWNNLLKMVNINPKMIERTEEEMQTIERDMAEFKNMQSKPGEPQQPTGEPGMPSEVNQEANVSSGL